MLRPRPCNWFELITSRDDLAAVLAALADTGAVELQTHERRGAPLVVGGAAMRALERFHELARIHRGRWPAARTDGAPRIADPAATLAAGMARIEAWRSAAEPLIAESNARTARCRHCRIWPARWPPIRRSCRSPRCWRAPGAS